jgi:hypothetical protein
VETLPQLVSVAVCDVRASSCRLIRLNPAQPAPQQISYTQQGPEMPVRVLLAFGVCSRDDPSMRLCHESIYQAVYHVRLSPLFAAGSRRIRWPR